MRASLKCLENIAFIGLGQMGSRMAPNLLKGPRTSKLILFDSDAKNLNDTFIRCTTGPKQLLVVAAKSIDDAIQEADVVITMLPNGDVVRHVYDEILNRETQKPLLLLDCSTVDHDVPMYIAKHEKLQRHKHLYLDCPVSGGIGGAEKATLTFMVGGQPFEKANAFLQPMGAKIFSCGAVGTGIVSKLANNFILAQSMIAVAEGMSLGTKMGVDPKILAEIISQSSGQCWSNDKYNPHPDVLPNVPSSNGYHGGFASALMLKDIRLALNASNAMGLTTPGGNNALTVYDEIVKSGNALKDFSFVFQHLKSVKK